MTLSPKEGSSSIPSAAAESVQESKASMFRGYIDALRRAGLFEAVRARVSPDFARTLDHPPPSSVWIPARDTDQLILAIEAAGGLAAVRKLSRDAVLLGLVPVLRGAIEAFLRLFGATPTTLLARISQLTSTSSRGVSYEYESTGDCSAVIVARYPSRRNMPIALFVAAAGGFEAIYELCGVQGKVSDPEVLSDGIGNAARFTFEWTPRR